MLSHRAHFSILTTTKGREKGTCVKSCEEEEAAAAAADIMLLMLEMLATVVVVVVEKEGEEDKEPAKETGRSKPSLWFELRWRWRLRLALYDLPQCCGGVNMEEISVELLYNWLKIRAQF